MDNLASGTHKQFRNLIDLTGSDATRPDNFGLGPSVGDDAMLGPSVGDDTQVMPDAASPPVLTMLGPSVGDDTPSAPNVTMLGPSVGDDGVPVGPSLTMLGPSVGDDGMPSESDLRLKEDVQRVGTTVFGLPLYHFKYIGAPETYEGVMAQDVLQVMPSAVSAGADGYYRVNYGALGTSMRQVS